MKPHEITFIYNLGVDAPSIYLPYTTLYNITYPTIFLSAPGITGLRRNDRP